MQEFRRKIKQQQEMIDPDLLHLYVKKGYAQKISVHKATYMTQMGKKVVNSTVKYFDGRIVENYAVLLDEEERVLLLNPIK